MTVSFTTWKGKEKMLHQLKIQKPLTIEKYIRQGHQVLDKSKWDKWDKHVPISVNALYHGLELEHVLKLIKMLDIDGYTFEDTYQELASQNHTNLSLSVMLGLLTAFCDRAQEFIRYYSKRNRVVK